MSAQLTLLVIRFGDKNQVYTICGLEVISPGMNNAKVGMARPDMHGFFSLVLGILRFMQLLGRHWVTDINSLLLVRHRLVTNIIALRMLLHRHYLISNILSCGCWCTGIACAFPCSGAVPEVE